MKASTTGFNPTYEEDGPTYEDLQTLGGYALLEFGAPWCGHCLVAQPAIEQALSEQDLLHIKVYDGKGKVLGRAFGVTLWPTLIVLQSGHELARVVRPVQTDQVETLMQWIKE